MTPAEFFVALGSIVIIDIVLGGDNAILIALASKNLCGDKRKKAMLWGVVGAVAVRSMLAIVALFLLKIPLLQFIGGVLLIWIAVKLLVEKKEVTCDAGSSLAEAVKIIIVADVLMGIDNIIAIAGASHGSPIMIVMGLLISVPIIVWGSSIILSWMDRFSWIIYVGAGVLAWTAGKMIAADKYVSGMVAGYIPGFELVVPAVVTAIVLIWGYYRNRNTIDTLEIE